EIELTYNWDQKEPYPTGRFFGHLAFEVDDIYACCARLSERGRTIHRPPRDGRMAFVKSPRRTLGRAAPARRRAAAGGAVEVGAQRRRMVRRYTAERASTKRSRSAFAWRSVTATRKSRSRSA